jgi:MoaA/NifB/PqqE/SkfB family radical SAM enzyme
VAAPDEFAFMLKTMAKAGIFELDILGGEPTLYPHLEQLVEAALKNKIKVFLSSNGLECW